MLNEKNVERVPSICKWNKQCQSKNKIKIHDRNKMTTKLKWKKAKNCRVLKFSSVDEGDDQDTSNLFLQPWTWNLHKNNWMWMCNMKRK